MPLLRKAFAPWHEGNVSATALDFAFDHAMFGATARREGKPASQHVSIVNGVLRMASNNDYRRDLLQDMLKTTQSLVPLPDVEFLANLWDHPKVPQQNVEAVFAMYVDDAHNDIPVPSAHAWDVERHAYPQPHTELKGGARCPPLRSGRRASSSAAAAAPGQPRRIARGHGASTTASGSRGCRTRTPICWTRAYWTGAARGR